MNWVKGQGFKKIVVLLNSGTAMEIEELKQDSAIDSILWIGNPGAYGTYGMAKLLSGELLPSGHLPDTWAVNSAKSRRCPEPGRLHLCQLHRHRDHQQQRPARQLVPGGGRGHLHRLQVL